jgi:hypothetical protein
MSLSPFHKALKNAYIAIKGDFLLPEYYTSGHEHIWCTLDADYCICQLCGWDHVCYKGHCPMVSMEHSEQICSISGCVILKTEMKPEWGIMERGAMMIEDELNCNINNNNNNKKKIDEVSKGRRGSHRKSKFNICSKKIGISKKIMKGSMEVHEFVEIVVREILDSQKTMRCREDEIARDKTKKYACLAKIIREMSIINNDSTTTTKDTGVPLRKRPNMIDIEARLSWMCRKCRYYNTMSLRRSKTLNRVIVLCVENITQLIKIHGWHRTNRQLQHITRGKEFVCSMLYLMRMGITFKNQTILQKVEILNELLPLQVFLPSIFNIRAKSITEGENIIKLDIQKMPL